MYMYVCMYFYFNSIFYIDLICEIQQKIAKLVEFTVVFFLIPKFIQFLCRKMAKFCQEKEKEKSSDITKM